MCVFFLEIYQVVLARMRLDVWPVRGAVRVRVWVLSKTADVHTWVGALARALGARSRRSRSGGGG